MVGSASPGVSAATRVGAVLGRTAGLTSVGSLDTTLTEPPGVAAGTRAAPSRAARRSRMMSIGSRAVARGTGSPRSAAAAAAVAAEMVLAVRSSSAGLAAFFEVTALEGVASASSLVVEASTGAPKPITEQTIAAVSRRRETAAGQR